MIMQYLLLNCSSVIVKLISNDQGLDKFKLVFCTTVVMEFRQF